MFIIIITNSYYTMTIYSVHPERFFQKALCLLEIERLLQDLLQSDRRQRLFASLRQRLAALLGLHGRRHGG